MVEVSKQDGSVLQVLTLHLASLVGGLPCEDGVRITLALELFILCEELVSFSDSVGPEDFAVGFVVAHSGLGVSLHTPTCLTPQLRMMSVFMHSETVRAWSAAFRTKNCSYHLQKASIFLFLVLNMSVYPVIVHVDDHPALPLDLLEQPQEDDKHWNGWWIFALSALEVF